MNRPIIRTSFFFIATFVVAMAAIIIVILFRLPDVSVWKTQNPKQTAFMRYRRAENSGASPARFIKKKWISINAVPLEFRRVVVVAEDASFWVHNGIDWYEMRQSFLRNLRKRRMSRGGSTITQQLAKNLYLSPHKSILRKIREAFIAVKLEKSLSKNRILELYLNNIELGPGIFGVETASEYYFSRNLANLSLDEMIRLAAIIPSPLKLNPNQPSPALSWRTTVILDRLHFYKMISEDQFLTAQNELDYFFGRKERPYYYYFIG